MSNVIDVTDQSFEQEVLKSDTPVLIDFWAEWCGPCKILGPVIDDVAKDFVGKIKFTKLNIDRWESKGLSSPIKIGKNCWIGLNSIILIAILIILKSLGSEEFLQ